MKKLLAIVLALVLAMSFVACGNSDAAVTDPSVAPTNNDGDSTQPTATEEPKVEITISETVLVDESGVKITAKSFEAESEAGPAIKLFIENNSDQDLTFKCRNVSVNGYMVSTDMAVDVVNGQTAEGFLTFAQTDLEACGIDMVADVEFAFHILYLDGWDAYLDTEPVQIKTSVADSYEPSYTHEGQVAYEGNNIKIIVKELFEGDSASSHGLVVYIENNGDKNISVQARDVTVNGFKVSDLFSCEVLAGKRAVGVVTFIESDLEANNITEITEVGLGFRVCDIADWDTIVKTKIIKYTF